MIYWRRMPARPRIDALADCLGAAQCSLPHPILRGLLGGGDVPGERCLASEHNHRSGARKQLSKALSLLIDCDTFYTRTND